MRQGLCEAVKLGAILAWHEALRRGAKSLISNKMT